MIPCCWHIAPCTRESNRVENERGSLLHGIFKYTIYIRCRGGKKKKKKKIDAGRFHVRIYPPTRPRHAPMENITNPATTTPPSLNPIELAFSMTWRMSPVSTVQLQRRLSQLRHLVPCWIRSIGQLRPERLDRIVLHHRRR